MKIQTNKKIVTIALTLILTLSAFMATLQTSSAHTPAQTFPTFAYLALSPDPVGINQPIYVIMWVSPNPPTASGFGGDIWRGFKLTITKPDGNTETKGPFNSDATGSTFTTYTPNQVGTYHFNFTYPGQVLSLFSPTGIPSDASSLATLSARLGLPDKMQYINDTFTGSSRTLDLIVQQQAIARIPDTPLPNGYWTRPIFGQNSIWASIASNWLGGSQLGGTGLMWQGGSGPNSPHILWTKPLEMGGIVGAQTALGVDTYQIPDVGFYSGGSYEGRFANAIIMGGRLYYPEPLGHSSTGGGYTCVDLKTGQQIWHSDSLGYTNGFIPLVGPNTFLVPSFGQLYDYESQNQHGVIDAILWAVTGTTWSAYDAWSGKWMYNLTNVPNGYTAYDNTGAIVRYVLNYNRATRQGWLALWNNTQHNSGLELTYPGGANASVAATTEAYQWRPNGKAVDMGQPYAYSWNVSLTADLSGLGAPSILRVLPGDVIIGQSSGISTFFSVGVGITPNPYTIWAISDKPATRGQLLWIRNYTAPEGSIARTFGGTQAVDTVNRVFYMQETETMAWLAYSIDTGDLVWGPTRGATHDFTYYGSGLGGGQMGYTAYGKLYTQGFGGEINCFDGKNGALLWTFNNTNSGIDTVWGYYPIFIAAIADGKVYAFNNEHSPNYPLYKGEQIYCLDATTGQEIYRMLSWAGQSGGPGTATSVLADGVLCYYNYYDNQIYAVGKGPSATSLMVEDDSVPKGESVMIKGMLTDQSAGAKQKVASGQLNSVPVVADESMGTWMAYIYMQQQIPATVTGVPVKLSAVYPDGTSHDLGSVTTDMSGMFKKLWQPPTEGEYTIYATFDGTNSYGGSYAETAIGVGAAASPSVITPTPTQIATPTAPSSVTPSVTPSIAPSSGTGQGIGAEVYIAIAAVIIIIAIVAVAVILRRRK
jgi:outer membrane protein assembly factor BamB